MALKQKADGTFEIRDEDEAVRALVMMTRIADEITEIEKEHGIDEMRQDAIELKKAATDFCISQGFERLDLPDGRWATLVESTQERTFVSTRDEMDENTPSYVVPLDEIVGDRTVSIKRGGKIRKLKLWNLLTRRVVDREKIEMAVGRNWLTVDEIAPSYYEKHRRPYLRIFGDKDA
jgi:hypothetical protein